MLPITTIIFQVVPVSAATVMMQEPFMLFYELVEGKSRVTTHPLVYSHQTVSFTESHKSPVNVGLIELTRLLDKRWLTDEVHIYTYSISLDPSYL